LTEILRCFPETLQAYADTYIFFLLLLLLGVRVRLSPLGTSDNNWPIVPAPGVKWIWKIWWNDIIGRGNRSTRRKSAPVLLCPPQIPHELGYSPDCRSGNPMTNRLSYMARPKCRDIISIEPLPLYSLSFPLYYSLFVSLFDAV
jgi:hypothetical protein